VPEELPLLSADDEEKIRLGELPFGGFLGNSVLLRVIQEVIADPYREFRPKALKILASSSPPSIKKALDELVSSGFMENISEDTQRPVYKVNLQSKRLIALTHLAYAVTDDRDGTNCMDDAIEHYCNDALFVQRRDSPIVYNQAITINHVNYIFTPDNFGEKVEIVSSTTNT